MAWATACRATSRRARAASMSTGMPSFGTSRAGCVRQQLANRTGLAIPLCHLPPGTSKWNKIEHRLFSHIAMNWRGTPLVDLATIVSLIGSTHSRSGLRVRSELDRGAYPSGVTVTDAQLATVRLEPHRFHGDWNYTIHPTTTRRHRVLVS